ncbi:MAG: DUF1465 family protein [Alphaproteobacteria bacterium]
MTGPMTAFIEESYQETLSLMTELRDYLTEIQAESGNDASDAADQQVSPEVRTVIIREISAITRDLTEAMAWLLLQKAAAAGEITPSEAETRADGLLGEDSALAATPPDIPTLPIQIRGYIDRSRRLYDQILRLRETATRQAG